MEFVRTGLEIKVYGEAYKMRLPTLREEMAYKQRVKSVIEDDGQVVEAVFSFLADLGLPKDVSEKLESVHLNQLVERILEKKTK